MERIERYSIFHFSCSILHHRFSLFIAHLSFLPDQRGIVKTLKPFALAHCLIAVFLSIPASSARAQTTTPGIDLEALIKQAGYKAIFFREGLWSISVSVPNKSTKKCTVFLEINPSTKNLRVNATVGVHNHLEDNEELKKSVEDLKARFKPTEFSLTRYTMFAVIEEPVDKLDANGLVKAVEKAVSEADRAYPEVAMLIKPEPAESLGPGYGGGMGAGSSNEPRGGGIGPREVPDPQSTSESSRARSPNAVDTKPEMIGRMPIPSYTEEARKNKVEGTVFCRILIDETGKVIKVMITRGLPDGLDEQALTVVYQMKFKPAMKDGKPVRYSMPVNVNFYLR